MILWARVVESAVVINLCTIATDTSVSDFLIVGSIRTFEGLYPVRLVENIILLLSCALSRVRLQGFWLLLRCFPLLCVAFLLFLSARL